ncbi:diguanylate cyclase (GGDEF)-like protein/PAS domain S-box-containing protein [Virgibacillus litoralis]|uniref:Diguanylate cyclase (GGDEF)-like protein/PAS domain S-box-containing protein n=2 Tax=Virgibacillus litoralis TaxID=578221 RepID=A0ABS4HAW0_9BACI|nr:diguanylate cyclase (GGDEF)-like protein/PAS domain S-box-containing protein [Virgibacillus litoralis]
MEGLSDMVFVMKVESGFEFTYDFVNRAAMEGTDITQAALGKTIKEVCVRDQSNFLYEQYKEVVISKNRVTFEDSYISHTGEKFYSKTLLTPLFNDSGQCEQIVGVVKDITKEKVAESDRKIAWDRLHESKERYHSLFHHNSDAIISLDLNGHITNGNVAVESISGYSPSEYIDSAWDSFVVEEDKQLAEKLFMGAISGSTENSNLTVHNKAGDKICLSIKVTPLIINEQVIGVYCILRDITELLKSQKLLEESQKRFQIIAEHANDLITLMDEKGKIIYASPSYKKILGHDSQDYTGKYFLHNVHPDDRKRLEGVFIHSINSGESFTVEIRQYNHQNETVWSQSHGAPVFDNRNNFIHMLVLTRDISLQKEYEMKLKDFAFQDPLTELPNRRLFNERLNQALEALTGENKDELAVIMLDIDRFKEVNDELGHDMGDRVIVEFGRRITQIVREKGIVARIGGDEFIILLPNIGSADEAVSIAKDIQQYIRKPWQANDRQLYITTSIGIAMSQKQYNTAFSLLKNADVALYEAKNRGRDSYNLWKYK